MFTGYKVSVPSEAQAVAQMRRRRLRDLSLLHSGGLLLTKSKNMLNPNLLELQMLTLNMLKLNMQAPKMRTPQMLKLTMQKLNMQTPHMLKQTG